MNIRVDATNLENDNDAEQSCYWSHLIYASNLEYIYCDDNEKSISIEDDE